MTQNYEEILDKIGKPGNFEEIHFFPVSAPVTSYIDKLPAEPDTDIIMSKLNRLIVVYRAHWFS